MNQYTSYTLNGGMMRELFFCQALPNAGYPIYFSKVGDFRVKDIVFEVGGKNKSKKQLLNSSLKGIVVRDDILVPVGDIIPLMLFGFLYP